MLDISVKNEIKRVKERLKKLEAKHPDEVFHCPVCNKYVVYYSNYDDMKMCEKCYTKAKTREMHDRVKHLIGGTIKTIQVKEYETLFAINKPYIKQIVVVTKEDKTVKLIKADEPALIF